MPAPGDRRLWVTTRPGESREIAPEGASVPVVSTGPPSVMRAAWMASVPPTRFVPFLPWRLMAGEMATPPAALIVSEWPLTQPTSAHPSNCASGPMKTSVAVIAVSPFRRTAPSR